VAVQLRGLDAAFLALESPTGHLQAVGVATLDPDASPITRDELMDLVDRRLHRLDLLRRRLVTVPGGIDRPYWIEVRPDLHRHVQVHSLPGDDPEALERFVAELAGRPLDRNAPMWEFWLVDGVPSGGQALLVKVHHSLCDGVGSLALVAQLFDEGPDDHAASLREPPTPVDEERPPPWPWLLGRAACNLARLPFGVASTVVEVARSALRLRVTVEGFDGAALAAPLATPHLSFHGPISGQRVVALRELPLDRVKAVAKASGTRVNDVVLAVLAGTLRRWLEANDELPGQPLVAAVPISTRAPEEVLEPGNHVSACFVHLPTDRADPRERLAVTAAVAASGKAIHAAVGASTLEHLTSMTFPLVLSVPSNLYQRTGAAERHPAPVNLVVSNVAGPPVDLYLAGRRATAFYALGPIFDGVSLNVTAMSYGNVLGFGYLACPDLIDDLDALADGQAAALDELAAAYGL
jgi:diacylglycerol O-acyltransferase / wax synthase